MPNQYVNKVVFGNQTLLDLTSDTVTADKLLQGYTAHDRSGVQITGTATQGGSVTQDQDGFIVLPPDGSGGGGGGGLEYETGTWTPTADIARPTINFTKTHTSMPLYVSLEDNTDTYDATSNTNYVFCYECWGVYHNKIWASESSYHYGKVTWSYRASNATSITPGAGVNLIYPSTDSASSNNQFPRYWVTETGFKPYTNSTTRYWRAGRTYKWIAVWAPTT